MQGSDGEGCCRQGNEWLCSDVDERNRNVTMILIGTIHERLDVSKRVSIWAQSKKPEVTYVTVPRCEGACQHDLNEVLAQGDAVADQPSSIPWEGKEVYWKKVTSAEDVRPIA